MIVPMKKFTVLVVRREQQTALAALRSLGVIHVEKQDVSNEEITRLNTAKQTLYTAQVVLAEAVPVKKREKNATVTLGTEQSLEVAEVAVSLSAAKKEKADRLEQLHSELGRIAAWGSLDPHDFEKLAAKGIHLLPVTVPIKARAVLNEYRFLPLKIEKKQQYALLWTDEPIKREQLCEEIRPLDFPELSTLSMHDEIESLKTGKQALETELASLALKTGGFPALDKELDYKLEYELVAAGMSTALLQDETPDVWQPDNLVWLSGFAPAESEHDLRDTAKREGWACIVADPVESDMVPTKLKNNFFVNLITPLTEFLGTFPGYHEPDVSLWFLLFFGVFFGMIFNDAGYGTVMTVGVLVMMLVKKIQGKPIPNAFFMFFYLGLFSVGWGVITCSWFGIAPQYLPEFLKKPAIVGISTLAEQTIRNKNLMALSFTLGALHLAIARIVAIVRSRKSLRCFGEIGSLAMLVGMYMLVLNMIVDASKYPMSTPFIIAIAAGFALKFVFDYYETGIGQSIMDSLKNFIAVFLGVVNVFADIVSYIRLWAVGLAGGAISMVVNQFVGPTLGTLFMFLGLILFVFGHGFNVILSVLSVIVHGVRLNTMEFSTHVGLTWSGTKYEPFSETLEK